MAVRPVFVPKAEGMALVESVPVEFKWHAGMASIQKKKNIVELHRAAKKKGINDILEISSKSDSELGRRLSAFSLSIMLNDKKYPLESVYQSSKVFRSGGPFEEVLNMAPREAKRAMRHEHMGQLIEFQLNNISYPLDPPNAFYDWLYINALYQHREWIIDHARFEGFTDIEFNPNKSINCQARAFAEFIALSHRGKLKKAANNFEYFSSLIVDI